MTGIVLRMCALVALLDRGVASCVDQLNSGDRGTGIAQRTNGYLVVPRYVNYIM